VEDVKTERVRKTEEKDGGRKMEKRNWEEMLKEQWKMEEKKI